MNIYYIIGAVLTLQVVLFFVFMNSKKKKDKQKQNEDYDRLLPVYNEPDTVKVALWINIDSVNGKPLDESFVYGTNLQNGILNSNKVEVALFKPGNYSFLVSSNSREEYKNVRMDVTLEPGETYQLGCNDEGPYFVLDHNPARYILKKAD